MSAVALDAIAPCGCSIVAAIGNRAELGEYCERCGIIYQRPSSADLETMVEIGLWRWEAERRKRIERYAALDLPLEQQLAQWPHPPGTRVRYWSGGFRGGDGTPGVTRSAAVAPNGWAGVYIITAGFVELLNVELNVELDVDDGGQP